MRLLAIATDPSLEVALTMMDDWEVLSVPDVRAAASRATGVHAMVIGIGSTDRGLAHAEAARSEGILLPIVVVGDLLAEGEGDTEVVIRPFSMDDIKAAIERAINSAHTRSKPRVVLDEPVAGKRDEESTPGTSATQPRAAKPDVVEPPAKKPVTTPDPGPPIGVIPAEEDLGIDLAEIEVPASEPAEPRAEQVADVAKVEAPRPAEPAPAPARRPEPEPVRIPPPREPSVPAPAATEPALPPTGPLTTAPPPRAQPEPEPQRVQLERPRRRFGRRGQPGGQTDESPLERMLRAAAHGAHAIEALLEEFPIVIDEATMTTALLREVVEMLSPSTAAVYVRTGDVFSIAASFGLSRAERTLTAKPDHPLFAELTINQEALLIAPIDLAQGLVAGIAGTHTNALLAAPICTEGEVIAFLVLGRSDYSEADLDVCDQIAREAGPGLAVARLLSTLTARRARDAS